jgi:hypothetical protein
MRKWIPEIEEKFGESTAVKQENKLLLVDSVSNIDRTVGIR